MLASLVSSRDLCSLESALAKCEPLSLDRNFANGPSLHLEVLPTGKSAALWGCSAIIRARAIFQGGHSSCQNCGSISELRAFLGA